MVAICDHLGFFTLRESKKKVGAAQRSQNAYAKKVYASIF